MKKWIQIMMAVYMVRYDVIVNQNVVPCQGSETVTLSTGVYQSPACVITETKSVEDKFTNKEAADEYAAKIKTMRAQNVRIVKK